MRTCGASPCRLTRLRLVQFCRHAWLIERCVRAHPPLSASVPNPTVLDCVSLMLENQTSSFVVLGAGQIRE
eukprot:scaffold209784_cov31-Tisochrysis_lutea.AAC.4